MSTGRSGGHESNLLDDMRRRGPVGYERQLAKRIEEWGEWMRETLLLDVPHRQVVFTIPKRLRVFFKFTRRLLGDLCRCAVRAILIYFQAVAGAVGPPDG